nr:MAG TPA: hypothetical protein [Caudoviricetes sp.]
MQQKSLLFSETLLLCIIKTKSCGVFVLFCYNKN